ncbi:MAG: agmatine deiminase family protein [Bacteroidales bacterium]|nr:agmatine deiminase family protein [Bacteroidales bacterium]
MKKILIFVAVAALTFGAVAQVNWDKEGLKHWRQTHQQRDASRSYLESGIKATPAVKGSEARKGKGMPQDRVWFPGEWEEVQAIVVTPYYMYYPTEGTAVVADPAVPGYAFYYNSYYAQRPSGVGPYGSEMDTSNMSGIGDVSFYLMDAIQLGGAQAWVRLEHEADSALVLRKLQRMGLRHNNIRFIVAPGNSFWYRDCGPICFYYGEGDTVGMLDFEYYPSRALDDSLPVYIERQFGLPNFTTQIEWEGGNCVVDGAGMVLSSDAIYGNNNDTIGQLVWDGVDPNTIGYSYKASLTRQKVKDSLAALIGSRATYILPSFKYDGGTGHVDLYADMLDENLFVFSQMPEVYSNWYDYRVGKKNMDSLCSYESVFGATYRSRRIPFPSTNNGGNFATQSQYDNLYTRTYSNHTFVNNVIIQPCFSTVGSDGMPTAAWDRANIEEIKKAYPGYTIYCVDVREFDGSGGAIHCITKQIPAEHPIRILHQAIYGNTGTTYTASGVPVMATITSADGIDTVVLHYRVDNGAWVEVPMLADAINQYAALIPTGAITVTDYVKIDYYISATSHAGKTITKPMTALQGGHHTFYLGVNPEVSIAAADPEEGFGQFYPNPASGQASLQIDLGEGGIYSVAIVDASGRTVHTSSLQATGTVLFTVDAQRLATGVYNVVFQNGSQRIVRKLIVNHQ